jgi:uncharacterized RmlC-like cupin family protein
MSEIESQQDQLACKKINSTDRVKGKQGLEYEVGISSTSVGSTAVHMQLLTMPPGARARAHKHAMHETAIYILSGKAEVWYGQNLEHHTLVEKGDFFYIPADMPHLPYNPSDLEPMIAVIARTDPNEQEGVVLLPELDRLLEDRAPGVR